MKITTPTVENPNNNQPHVINKKRSRKTSMIGKFKRTRLYLLNGSILTHISDDTIKKYQKWGYFANTKFTEVKEAR